MNDNYAAQLERALRTKRAMPYLILSAGPALEACPEHKDNVGLILPVEDEYWIKKPMKEHPLCKCRVRQISKREFEKIMNEREK